MAVVATLGRELKRTTFQKVAHRFVHPALGAVLSCQLHVVLPGLAGRRLPDLDNLFDPVRPLRVSLLQLGVVLVGVEDGGYRCLVAQGLVTLPLGKLLTLSASRRGGGAS